MITNRISINDAAIAIRDTIITNPLSIKNTSDYISELDVDRNKLLPVFKTLTGLTINRFQLEQLMQAASKMLLSGMTVKEVAIECGYTNYPNNFTRSFKKVFKIGPEEWQHKELKKKKKH